MSGLVECPYNPEHKMPLDSLQKHFAKCKSMKKLKHLFKVCPFNPNHHVPATDFDEHKRRCKDKNDFQLGVEDLQVVVDPVADVSLVTPPPGFVSLVPAPPAPTVPEPKEALSPVQPQPLDHAAWNEVKPKKPKKKGESEEVIAQALSVAEMQLKQSVDPKKRKAELKKKLKEIENLLGKQSRGEALDLQQMEKVRKKKVLEDELSSLS